MPSTQPRQGGKVNSPQDEDGKKLDDEQVPESGGERSSQILRGKADAGRKKKRFRLTHGQTRFLMSEFERMSYPDAENLERLSLQIPRFTSKQARIWFQNRRRKIGRQGGNANFMTNMRVVPEGFDNVQALQSPYKAICNPNNLVFSPGHFVTQPHVQHLSLPSSPDTQWPGTNGYPSPTVITPSGRYTRESDFVTPLTGTSTMCYASTQERWQWAPIETSPVESPIHLNSSTSQTTYEGSTES